MQNINKWVFGRLGRGKSMTPKSLPPAPALTLSRLAGSGPLSPQPAPPDV